MLTRRHFGQGLGGAAVALVFRPRDGRGAPISMRMANAAGINDAQLAFASVGRHPKLGYYQAEGLDLDIVNMSSTAQTLQAMATEHVEFANISPITLIPMAAANPSLSIVCVYAWLRQSSFAAGVKPDSPIKTIADLQGKTVGIRVAGDTAYLTIQAMLRELGIDAARDPQWIPVGTGGPAGAALYNGHVDAIAIYDAELARIELAGFPLRVLPTTPGLRQLAGSAYGTTRAALAAHRERFVGLFRAMAKSTIFTRANPELAVRIHWQLYPESKPKAKSEADALREAQRVIRSRMDKWFAGDWQPDKRMGAQALAEWQAQLRFIAQQDKTILDKVQDVSAFFTNDLIDEINRFDAAAVAQQASTLSL